MLIDKRLRFADATALSLAAPATAKFGEALDMSVAADQGENAIPLYVVALVETTATSGGSATLELELVTADNEALSSNPVVLLSSAAVPVASLVAGYQILLVALPKATYKRWLGLRQVVGTAAFTAGKLHAFVTSDAGIWRAYADAAN